MRETLAEIWASIDWERKIIAFFGGVLVMTLAGPFGTYEYMSFNQRLVFWLVVFTGVGFFMHVFQTTALKSAYLGRMPRLLRLGIGAVLAGLPGAAVVIFVYGVFRPAMISAEALPVIWMQVALIGWAVGTVEFFEWRQASAPEETPTRRTVFHKRLPPALGDDIISISMQDHYAEVTTPLGSHLVLIRLSDALAELKGAAGLQVHRSHYVMTAHMERLCREGGRLRLRLTDGRELPVSARYADKVRVALKQKAAA
ncbi:MULTISPECIES: LytTR family DNA-binding domain-containing protein [Marinovum]|uniref:LytTR family DNA-binding domain-containing protein n=1 Tax=Marinovum TaxID=367771 RepID=UPI00237BCEC7|nr:LytTR family DNA-binding domain-containing protein [Marinovum sp. PR37]MDD9744221.1 LytTR family DNA-binding domain-containing protein [Marinovum sp. PR37]